MLIFSDLTCKMKYLHVAVNLRVINLQNYTRNGLTNNRAPIGLRRRSDTGADTAPVPD